MSDEIQHDDTVKMKIEAREKPDFFMLVQKSKSKWFLIVNLFSCLSVEFIDK